MKNKKMFIAGLAVGMVLVVFVNFVIGRVSSIYEVFAKGEISYQTKVKALYNILDRYYVDDYDKEVLLEGMYAGLISELGDPYSSYMSTETLNRFLEDTEGTYSGIGVVITVDKDDNSIMVVAPFEDSPGEAAGILPGDKFIKINNIDVSGADYNVVPQMTKGPKGTKVNVTIYRPSENRVFDVDIVRDDIIANTVSHRMLENAIGYLRISQFDRVTYSQFVEAYNDLSSSGMRGLIIDLRNNPGGLLDVVKDITDTLVPEGYILYTEDKHGNKEYYNSDSKSIEIPLAILVNGNSASASEVMSGAVKDLGSGVLVGTQTFGKGLVQNLYTLPDGSGVKVTIAKYYTPSGVCINGEGITPDYIVEMDEEKTFTISTLEFEEDQQLQKAFEVVNGKIKK